VTWFWKAMANTSAQPAGRSREARIAMIEITTSSSTRVNAVTPRCQVQPVTHSAEIANYDRKTPQAFRPGGLPRDSVPS